jgi:hypothetical protein
MAELKLKQLQYESETWKRLLGFTMDENIHLKNRLSEVLKEKFDKNLLDDVENFQSRFIRADEMIRLLRNDIGEFDRLLAREIFEDGQIISQVEKELKRLRKNIKIAEQELGILKAEFNSYLSENI